MEREATLKRYRFAALFAAAALLGACATAGKTADVRIGMTKQEVVSTIGPPDSGSAQGNTEVLSYYLCYSNCAALIMENRGRNWYYVRITNGRVDAYGNNEAFGIKGDFDSGKVITRNSNVKQEVMLQGTDSLYADLKKLQELRDTGVLTAEEFEVQKKKLLAR